ncbi:hypothetical protein RUM44_005247 [Polyplax serrata]|uniref:Uncharacterized protein n=1 Tax=Polyplax serrata TaxID=468196 RepID=A0ABR1AEI2_POLSC
MDREGMGFACFLGYSNSSNQDVGKNLLKEYKLEFDRKGERLNPEGLQKARRMVIRMTCCRRVLDGERDAHGRKEEKNCKMIEFETEKGLKEGKDRERNKPGGRERRNNERKKGISREKERWRLEGILRGPKETAGVRLQQRFEDTKRKMAVRAFTTCRIMQNQFDTRWSLRPGPMGWQRFRRGRRMLGRQGRGMPSQQKGMFP